MDRWREIGGILLAAGASFLAVNFVHFQTLPVYVILYACAIDAAIAVPLGFLVQRGLARAPSRLTGIERVLTGVIAVLGILLYAILGPTVIDRSLSLYIVEKLDQRGGAVAVAAMPAVFVQEYLPEFRVVDVRLTEQVQSGTAIITDGCVRLTPRGHLVAQATRLYRRAFLPRKRVLMGEVTDVLTDPFRDSVPVVDVTCPR